MKILIWIGCIFMASIFKVILAGNSSMGAIPTMILYGAMFAVAGGLCKAWDNRKASKLNSDTIANSKNLIVEHDIASSKKTEETSQPVQPPITFCRKCGYKLIDDNDFCNYCGEKIMIKEVEVQDETILS